MTTTENPRIIPSSARISTNSPRVLRDYQTAAIAAVRNEWLIGNNRTAIVHATGLGKTDIIAKLATDEALAGGRVLLLAHRSEPLDQMTARCAMHAPSVSVGRVQGQRNETGCAITVASVATISHAKRVTQLTQPTMVVIDECHHAMAASYQKIMAQAGCFEPNGTRTLGVTATLVRGDGQGFGRLFQSVADDRGIEWAVSRGWLVRPFGRAVALNGLRLDQVTKRHGDYAEGELGAMITEDARAIVTAWLREAGNRITVAFTPTKASAATVLAAFIEAGVPAELVVGTTPAAARTAIYGRLASGATRVLVSVMVTTEAWDCPPVACVLIARPTQQLGLYEQMVGRGLRLSDGKTDCLVLDTVGKLRDPRLVTLIDMMPSALYTDTEALKVLTPGRVLSRREARAYLSTSLLSPRESMSAKLRSWFTR
ncbi:MAG: DEAD/DEAH box helicase [Mycobacterium sp.]